MNLAQRHQEADQVVPMRELLQGYRPGPARGAVEEDLRDFEWYYLWPRCNLKVLSLKGHTEGVYGVTFPPDGRRLATASADKMAKVWDARTGKELRSLQGHTGPVWGVSFSPGGCRLDTASSDKTAKAWIARENAE